MKKRVYLWLMSFLMAAMTATAILLQVDLAESSEPDGVDLVGPNVIGMMPSSGSRI